LPYKRFKQTNVPLYLEYAPLSAKIADTTSLTDQNNDDNAATETPTTDTLVSKNDNANDVYDNDMEFTLDDPSSSSNAPSLIT